MPRISKVYQISDKDFKNLVASSKSYSDILRSLGLTTKGGSSLDILKRRINELNCSISHFGTDKVSSNIKYQLEDILVQHSTYAN